MSTDECTGLDCESGLPSVGKTQLCQKCINAFKADGWKFRTNGNRVREGVVVTPRGAVNVQVGTMNSRMMSLLAGEIPVEDLDDEELARGMCRNPDGTFPKRAPEMVPKVIHDRMMRTLYARAEEGLRLGLVDAVESIVGIATNEAVAPGDRLRAAQFVLERIMGKTPDKVLISQEKPFEVVLDRIARGPRQRELPDAG